MLQNRRSADAAFLGTMGLDSVELVMVVEREFDLEIPDDAASEMFTVGHMYEFVRGRLEERARQSGGAPLDESQLWDRLLDIIVEETGVERHKLVRTARFRADLGVN